MSDPVLERWLVVHPYLRPLAELCSAVDRALSSLPLPEAVIPAWESYRADFGEGVPLLSSDAAVVNLAAVGPLLGALLGKLETEPLPGPLAAEVLGLSAELRQDAGLSPRIVSWLLGDESVEPPSPGLLRFLGWTALARYLRPVVEAFGQWRDEERWLRRYCPTCGSPPAMGQIAGVDPARHRLLSCGCCGTRWRYRRTQCPFCENDAHRVMGLKVEGEPGLRLDHCEACGGYLKTYDGQGQEALLLADWTSLHLDLLAHRRGLVRQATSLYDVESLAVTPSR
ncbi:MAG TPA: formate dehydrogenase accessory protein FdhE [Myxococcaceae bacterium]|nr:formate dehydrogenase accessory protein FdhE [Myxococcaceae bacterium]